MCRINPHRSHRKVKMSKPRLHDWILEHPFGMIVVWFLLVGGVLVLLTMYSETFGSLAASSKVPSNVFGDLGGAASSGGEATPESALLSATLALGSLFGAVIFAIPIAWIYTSTRREEGYDTSFVRMLVGLPVVVAGVVRIVQGDLALAFALAGIVAAVRFRTTVKDLQNAVFAFAVIGIGLATGTGSFFVALALAIVFCGVTWTMWRFDVGKADSGLRAAAGHATLADALVPGVTHRAVTVGDEEYAAGIHSDNVPNFEEVAEELAHYVRADALRSKRKYDTLLLAFTRNVEDAAAHIESVVEAHTTRCHPASTFSLVEDTETQSPYEVVTYLLRLEKKIDVYDMMDALECGGESHCVIRAAQLKPIKGLRKWLT